MTIDPSCKDEILREVGYHFVKLKRVVRITNVQFEPFSEMDPRFVMYLGKLVYFLYFSI